VSRDEFDDHLARFLISHAIERRGAFEFHSKRVGCVARRRVRDGKPTYHIVPKIVPPLHLVEKT
jgi:hypothetical protein